ncbi:uncharacterized protein LOC107046086 [Diachasma alloeum]|uniref:uncharacterized protein LOC107046086 n=1 Tax=Diachasma alloeum TaxID=454923 RepID=UPI0007383CF9|nr:uncharacterized protein LOC107046086 [Diachasma alloeum]
MYASVLTKRLEREMEEKGIVPDNQTGFRRGMATIDDIFMLNYLVNWQVQEKGGKLVTCFIDLKAAFDSVSRKVLWEVIRDRGISDALTERVKEIYRETASKRNGRQEKQVKSRIEKAGNLMGPVWGMGKRRLKRDWKRRIWLFDSLVWSVVGYGAEI